MRNDTDRTRMTGHKYMKYIVSLMLGLMPFLAASAPPPSTQRLIFLDRNRFSEEITFVDQSFPSSAEGVFRRYRTIMIPVKDKKQPIKIVEYLVDCNARQSAQITVAEVVDGGQPYLRTTPQEMSGFEEGSNLASGANFACRGEVIKSLEMRGDPRTLAASILSNAALVDKSVDQKKWSKLEITGLKPNRAALFVDPVSLRGNEVTMMAVFEQIRGQTKAQLRRLRLDCRALTAVPIYQQNLDAEGFRVQDRPAANTVWPAGVGTPYASLSSTICAGKLKALPVIERTTIQLLTQGVTV